MEISILVKITSEKASRAGLDGTTARRSNLSPLCQDCLRGPGGLLIAFLGIPSFPFSRLELRIFGGRWPEHNRHSVYRGIEFISVCRTCRNHILPFRAMAQSIKGKTAIVTGAGSGKMKSISVNDPPYHNLYT